MSFIAESDSACLEPRVQAMYQRQIDAFGYLPNYAPLFSHRVEVIDVWAELLRTLRRHVEPRLFELVTLAAAIAVKGSYCALAHGSKLQRYFDDVEIARIAAGGYDDVVEPAEAAAMRYAAKVAGNASAVTGSDVAPLRAAGYSDAQIFDIAGIAAGRAFFSNLVEGLGARADRAYHELPAMLKQHLVVGRDIEPGA